MNDPDVDMFAAIFDDDLATLEKALANGADTSLTDRQVLAAHQSRLENFYRAPTEQELRDLVTRAEDEIGGKAGDTFVHFGRAAIDGSHDDKATVPSACRPTPSHRS